jgi:L-alanine-DL-glutamate epimerase-like enolase superfamily enzyme
MHITKIETVQITDLQRYLWVRIHTDDGLVGLGETYIHASSARLMIEEVYAPEFLLGQDPFQIEKIWDSIFERISFAGWCGAEIRAMSAIDIALWDILGKYSELPVYQLLGGKYRDLIPIYNTCGLEDQYELNNNPVDLAKDLLANGIRAMKIWPFDEIAKVNNGQYISPDGLKRAISPIQKIRHSLGNSIDIAVEFHGYWNLPCAILIAQALEEYQVLWLEDIINPDNLYAYEHLKEKTSIPIILSERLMTRFQFLPILQRGLAQILNPDVEWCGGISEAKKIASLAEIYHVPVAFHNYGGPILNFASAHLAANIPNLMILETGRTLISRWSQEVIDQAIPISNGHFLVPEGPGLGVNLSNDFLQRSDLIIRVLQ